MRKTSYILFALIFIIGCSTNGDKYGQNTIKSNKNTEEVLKLVELPKINEPLSENIWINEKNEMLLTSTSTLSPSTKIQYDDNTFEIAWNDDHELIYIQTIDSNFRTPEGIRIGMKLKELGKIEYIDYELMPGWGYYLKLNSGWNAAFCVDSNCTGRNLSDEDRIKWIFKI